MSSEKLTILFVSSEMVPYSKTGGLADVAGSLTKSLARMGHRVEVFVPFHKNATTEPKKFAARSGKRITIPIGSSFSVGRTLSIEDNPRRVVNFIAADKYFKRPALYGPGGGAYHDNLERFAFFNRCALAAIEKLKIKPDIIHVNDWQSSLIPVYLKTLPGIDPSIGSIPTILTIHNMGYQGLFSAREWIFTGLDFSLYHPLYLEFHHQVNLLKGGIIFSDLISSVSPTYARQILTPEHGWGLDGVLRDRSADLYGALNGIDLDEWNPQTDKLIAARYSVDDLSGKRVCKTALLKKFGLKPTDAPVVGIISRLAEQKGFDLLLEIIDPLLDLDIRFVALGAGDPRIEERLRALRDRRPDLVGVEIGYNSSTAHAIEAGADIFFMPSRYEPCGLNQLYSLQYGTVPLVHATGGLADTVFNFDQPADIANGFTFSEPTPTAFYQTATMAISLFKNDPTRWRALIENGMRADYSWNRSARRYVDLYRLAIARAKGKRF